MSSCDTCKSKDGCASAASGSCPSDGEKKPESMIEKLRPGSSIKKVFGICSGKGGVGTSLVTSVIAAKLARLVYHHLVPRMKRLKSSDQYSEFIRFAFQKITCVLNFLYNYRFYYTHIFTSFQPKFFKKKQGCR